MDSGSEGVTREEDSTAPLTLDESLISWSKEAEEVNEASRFGRGLYLDPPSGLKTGAKSREGVSAVVASSFEGT